MWIKHIWYNNHEKRRVYIGNMENKQEALQKSLCEKFKVGDEEFL